MSIWDRIAFFKKDAPRRDWGYDPNAARQARRTDARKTRALLAAVIYVKALDLGWDEQSARAAERIAARYGRRGITALIDLFPSDHEIQEVLVGISRDADCYDD